MTRKNRIGHRVAAGLTAVLAIGGLSTKAYANGWGIIEGFEYQPATTWTLYHSAVGSGGFDINAGTARSGTNAGWLSVQTGWSSVGTTIHITPAELHDPTCAAQVYVRPFNSVTLNFEIIDPGTWTYVALQTVTLTGSSYQAVTINSFVPPNPNVFIRVSLTGNGNLSAAHVDDLNVFCQYY